MECFWHVGLTLKIWDYSIFCMKNNSKLHIPTRDSLKSHFGSQSNSSYAYGNSFSLLSIKPLEQKIIAISAAVTFFCVILLVFLIYLRPEATQLIQKAVLDQAVETVALKQAATIKITTTEDLLENLQAQNLWDIHNEESVTPVLFTNFPEDMKSLDVDTKKKAFFHTMLPLSLIALDEVEREKSALTFILAKLADDSPDKFVFDPGTIWPAAVSPSEIKLLHHLSLKYRTSSRKVLRERVDVLPVSLILAQSALESSWGSSRFVSMGNNLFGIWTWGEKGIVPANRSIGSTHKIAVYDSLLDSVRAYLLMLNRLPAYASLRQLRSQSRDSVVLTNGLLYYSERRKDYIRDVQRVITGNDLKKFDNFNLAENYRWNLPDSFRVVSLPGKENAKL